MKNNFVAKNNYNRSSVHTDLKNDYDRSANDNEIMQGLEDYLEEQDSTLKVAQAIAIDECARVK